MGNTLKATSPDAGVDIDSTQNGLEDDMLADMLATLQDYPSPDVGEPIFRMGEKLKVISQETCWWRVRSVQTGRENYIPNSHVAKVYHGWLFEGVVREKAEELLCLPGNRVGSFMVRESVRERGVYCLSVKSTDIKHYRVLRLANSWYYISPRLTFQCLEEMINHYSDSADGLCCVLTSPCLSGMPPPDPLTQAPPVVMRRHFDWKDVERKDLNASCSDTKNSMVSYGVRNSLADYLSLADLHKPPQQKNNRKKSRKSKSVYVLSTDNLQQLDYEDGF